MRTLKTLYGIIFFVIWAVVGWIKEVAKCRGDRMDAETKLECAVFALIGIIEILLLALPFIS